MAQLRLVLIATVKTAMKVPVLQTADDPIIDGIILGISYDFEKQTGRGVDLIARTEYFDVDESTNRLLLKGFPVAASPVIQIFQDIDRNFGAATEVDTEFYFLDAEEGVVELFQRYPIGRKTIKVIYTGGMALMDSPAVGEEFWNLYPDIAEAAIHEIITQFKMYPQLGAQSIKIANDSTTIFKPLSRTPLFQKMITNNTRAKM